MKLKIGKETVFYQKSNKFKNVILGVFLAAPFNLKYQMEWPIIGSLLEKTNALYKTEAELQNFIYDNYGLAVSVDTFYSGETYLFRFFISYVNPKYLPEQIELNQRAFELLQTTILKPDFTEDKLEIEKYYIRNSLINIKSNKQKYAFQEYMKTICEGSITEKVINKTIDQLNKVTIDSVKEAYQAMLSFARLFFIAGDIKSNDVKSYFSSLNFPKAKYDYKKLVMYEKMPSCENNVKEKIIDDPTKSSILYIGYKTNTYYFDDDFYAFGVLSLILGGGSYSETYRKIREEKGLVYYIDCNYDKRRGIITFVMEIARENYEQVLCILKDIIKEYKQGSFDEKILDLAKQEISNMLARDSDRESSVCNMLYDELDHLSPLSTKEVLERYMSINKDDIIRVSKKMVLDTILFLRGDE